MATLKIVLRRKQNSDGTYPLAVRVTKDRRSSFIHTGQTINEKYWDDKNSKIKKSHPNSERLNNFLIKKLSEANDKLLELDNQKNLVTAQAVRHGIKPMSSGATFFSYAQMYLDNFKTAGKYNRLHSDGSRIGRFREFLKDSDIAFQDITIHLLNTYKAYLKGTHKLSERSIVNHLINIRTVYNMAIKANIIDPKYYPFGKDKIVIKLPDSIRIGLNPEDVKLLENLELKPGSNKDHARNVWLFSFYFAGMRISDVLRLKWSDFQNERLHYSMAKNDKAGSLKIPEKALKILSQYEEKKDKTSLVFPELKGLENLNDSYQVQRKISYAITLLNKHLKDVAELAEIDKKLTMHIARHTFGNISGELSPSHI